MGPSRASITADPIVELVSMTGGRAAGYTPFADAPPFQDDEETPLPVSIAADEMSHLNKTAEPETAPQADDHPTTLSAVVNFIWQGGSPGDAWLHMTAAQVLCLLFPLIVSAESGCRKCVSEGQPGCLCLA